MAIYQISKVQKTMGQLVLDSLEIQGFRLFKHLTISELGQINLIVGKNNVGKTCLLEALRLYLSQGNPNLIWELLQTRNEFHHDFLQLSENSSPTLAIKHLFNGRQISKSSLIEIGPCESSFKSLLISLTNFENLGIKTKEDIHIRMGTSTVSKYSLFEDFAKGNRWKRPEPLFSHLFISSIGLDNKKVEQLWENIVHMGTEDNLVKALQILLPQAKSLNMVTHPHSRLRVPIVKLENMGTPIVLQSFGEGVHRLFGLILALVNVKNGVLLIDEIENGLHYSILSEVWLTIFKIAKSLNVQIFATTHNWDCIQGFQEATAANPDENASLIRLRNQKGNIVADLFDRNDLETVTRNQVEVR